MGDFELEVTVESHEQVSIRARSGASTSDSLDLNDLRKRTIGIFERWLSKGALNQRKEFEVLGGHLFEAIFNGKVRKFFEERLSEAQKAGQSLVIRLRFQEKAADLADLPWEYLYYEHDQQFLSTRNKIVLTRDVAFDKEPETLAPESSPITILVVVASPKNLAPVRGADRVIEAMQNIFSQVKVLEAPTQNSLLDKLGETENGPHILHFIGHGRYERGSTDASIALLLENNGNASWVNASSFAELFVQTGIFPRLVLLHLCESAADPTEEITDNTDPIFIANFARLGRQLLRIGIPAIVAMQYPIPHQLAVDFSQFFYRDLANGKSIDDAVQRSRFRIAKGYSSRDFGTPVLYMHNSGSLVQVGTPTEDGTSSRGPRPPTPNSRANSGQVKQNEEARDKIEGSSSPDRAEPTGPLVTGDGMASGSAYTTSLSKVTIAYNAGKKKIDELGTLPTEQQADLLERNGTLCDELEQLGDQKIVGRLFTEKYGLERDDPFRQIISAMIDALKQSG